MGGAQSSSQQEKKEKVEKLFRQNNRTSRSRSLDVRQQEKPIKPARPVGSSHSARYSKNRYITRVLDDGENGTISGLSREEKRMIEVCWFKCSPKQIKKFSEDIFYDILQTDNELLSLFNLKKMTMSRLKENTYFKSHAANFAIVLNLVVTNMQENFEQVCDALQSLGQQHLDLKSKGFQSSYWDVFTDCFEHNCPASFRKEPEKEAWSRMILFILAQMKLGYQRGDLKTDTRLSVPSLI